MDYLFRKEILRVPRGSDWSYRCNLCDVRAGRIKGVVKHKTRYHMDSNIPLISEDDVQEFDQTQYKRRWVPGALTIRPGKEKIWNQ